MGQGHFPAGSGNSKNSHLPGVCLHGTMPALSCPRHPQGRLHLVPLPPLAPQSLSGMCYEKSGCHPVTILPGSLGSTPPAILDLPGTVPMPPSLLTALSASVSTLVWPTCSLSLLQEALPYMRFGALHFVIDILPPARG